MIFCFLIDVDLQIKNLASSQLYHHPQKLSSLFWRDESNRAIYIVYVLSPKSWFFLFPAAIVLLMF